MKARRKPADRKSTAIVRYPTPSPANTPSTSANTTAENVASTTDQELSRLASHYTSQLNYMSIEEIQQEAGIEQDSTPEDIETSPEK